MRAILNRLRSVGRAYREETDDRTSTAGNPNAAELPSAKLFHCSTCDVVYVATEKRVCSQCGDAVEPVRSTLRHA